MKLVAYLKKLLLLLYIIYLSSFVCLSVRPSLCNARRACPKARPKDVPFGARDRRLRPQAPEGHGLRPQFRHTAAGRRSQAPGLRPAPCGHRPPLWPQATPHRESFHFFYPWDNSTFFFLHFVLT